jgi:hypothetical protein
MAAPAFAMAEMKPLMWPRTDVGNGSAETMLMVLFCKD